MFKYSVFALVFAKTISADYPAIAGYAPASDVTGHNAIDLDQAIVALGPTDGNFSNMIDAYSVGGNSVKGSGSIRTLQGFSTGLYDKAAGIEPYFDKQVAYFDDNFYGDSIVSAALDGTGLFASSLDSLRKEVATKGSAYLIAGMYAFHELEDAITDCNDGTINDNDDSVHAWDEGVAFYTGTLEGETAGGNSAGEMSYRLAEKRCANFGTCTGSDGVTGISKVNQEIFELFDEGQANLLELECEDAKANMEDIQAKALIPLIQGTIRYIFKGDPAAATLNGYDDKSADTIAKEQGEGYIFAMSIIGYVADCDAAAAAVLEDNLGLTEANFMSDGYAAVLESLQSVYTCLGVTCEDVGGLLLSGSTDEFYDGLGPCSEDGADAASMVTPAAAVFAAAAAYALQ